MSESRPLFTWESLEGEYVRWVNIYQVDVDAFNTGGQIFIVDNRGNVYLQPGGMGATPFYTFDRTGAWTLRASQTFAYFSVSPAWSVGGKYVVVEDTAPVVETFRVYRYGEPIFTRALTDDLATVTTYYNTCMSPNGRYIAIQLRANLPPIHDFLFLYEGRESLT